MKKTVEPFVKAIYQEIDTTPKPFKGIREAHVGGMGSTHLCSKACLNIPTQTCANVCGVAVAVLGAVACTAPELWRNVFLRRGTDFPTTLKWFLSPSDFLRCSIISWFLTDQIDVSLIGIKREDTPTRSSDAPSRRRRLAGTVIISDDEHEDKNEKERTDTQECPEPITSRQQRKFTIVAEESNNHQESDIRVPRDRARKNRRRKKAQRVEAGAGKNGQKTNEKGDYHAAQKRQSPSMNGGYFYSNEQDGGRKKRKKAKVKTRNSLLKDYLRSCVSEKYEGKERDGNKCIYPESLTIDSMEGNKCGISPESGKITSVEQDESRGTVPGTIESVDRDESSGVVLGNIDSVEKEESSGTDPGKVNSLDEHESSGSVPGEIDRVGEDESSVIDLGKIDGVDNHESGGTVPGEMENVEEDGSSGVDTETIDSVDKHESGGMVPGEIKNVDEDGSSGVDTEKIDSADEHESGGTVPGEMESLEEDGSSGADTGKIDSVDEHESGGTVPGEMESMEEDGSNGADTGKIKYCQ